VLEVASDVLGVIRGAKTGARRSMRSPVATLQVTDSAERIAALLAVESDLCDAGGVLSMATAVGEEPSVEVVLADEG
jgi:valyl-tRNA synthetase